MKILFFITSLDVGGAERQVLDLAQRLESQQHEILIAYLTGTAKLLPKDSSLKTIGFHAAKSPKSLVESFFLLRDTIKSFKPDVVHSHMVHANLLARLVRLTIHIPRLICTAHSTNEGGGMRMFAYRFTNFLADATTNVSQGAVKEFEARKAVKPGTMLMVPNGIDTDRFSFSEDSRQKVRGREGVSADQKIILAVGRFTEAKNYPSLLHAFASVLKSDSALKLWIVGDGVLREALLALTEVLGISQEVTFFGVREDVADFYSAADVYVLSSSWEGFGLVVAEAMAAERVVVASDCGGVKEVLGNEGVLVRPGSSDDLAVAIRSALDIDPVSAAAMGRRARQRILDKYSLDTVVRRWVELYRT
ncbi:glycosyltransferase [Pseudomonas chlororaphis]|uniref:glycosyltransferase n=1 Tax=Pseudomonas TaxID=286 RepID=UPI0009E25CCB|nr:MULTISPECIES: glycosyltransferase [Pseudomonas]MCB2253434.1 glycosyltransferase [Pseudomonas chlororaphis]